LEGAAAKVACFGFFGGESNRCGRIAAAEVADVARLQGPCSNSQILALAKGWGSFVFYAINSCNL